MRSLFFLLCLSLFLSPALGEQVFFFPQIADGRAGTLQFLTEIILVTTGNDTEVVVEFFDQDGGPLVLELDGDRDSRFEFQLARGQGLSVTSSGTGDLQVGYARVASSEDGVGGTAVFTGVDVPSGTALFEAGVPASVPLEKFTLFLDSLGRRNTGLALARPMESQMNFSAQTTGDSILTIYDSNFNQIATTDVPIQPGAKVAKFINEFFPDNPQVSEAASEMQGIVTVQGPPMAAVTLRQTVPERAFPDGVTTLTTFPVTPGIPEDAVVSSQVSTLSDGRLQVALVVGKEALRAGKIQYRLWAGEVLVDESERDLSRVPVHVHRLAVPEGAQVSRVEALLFDSLGSLIGQVALTP